jgi:hypothetical protein
VHSPAQWGVQEVARRRLEPLLDDLELRTRTVTLSFPDPDAFFAALVHPNPLDAGQREAIRSLFDQLLASCNNAPPGVQVDGRYLIALGRRRVRSQA